MNVNNAAAPAHVVISGMRNITVPAPPPTFVKTNHHYVPQFWMRLFAGPDNHLWRRLPGGPIQQTSTDRIMAEDWLYTEFDHFWRPGDAVEDRLSVLEGRASLLLETLKSHPGELSDQQWAQLNHWLALTACRHPLAMRRMHRRAKELAWNLADVKSYSAPDFVEHIKRHFGVTLPENDQSVLAAHGEDALLEEADRIEALSQHDPQLPMLIALSGVQEVALRYAAMDKILLDAPPGKGFVLGDTPVTLSGASAGFAVPLTAKLACGFWPNNGSGLVTEGRAQADPAMVDLINKDQAVRSMAVVVGPDRATLSAL